MSIVYEYYRQSSSSVVAFGKSSSSYAIQDYNSINHIVVTPTVDCFVLLSQVNSSSLSADTTGTAQFIGLKNQTPIPAIGCRYVSVIGQLTNGLLYITEFSAG